MSFARRLTAFSDTILSLRFCLRSVTLTSPRHWHVQWFIPFFTSRSPFNGTIFHSITRAFQRSNPLTTSRSRNWGLLVIHHQDPRSPHKVGVGLRRRSGDGQGARFHRGPEILFRGGGGGPDYITDSFQQHSPIVRWPSCFTRPRDCCHCHSDPWPELIFALLPLQDRWAITITRKENVAMPTKNFCRNRTCRRPA